MPLGEVPSQGCSMASRTHARGRDDAVSTLRQANVAGLDGAGRRFAGRNVCQWAFRCDQAVAPTRGAIVIRIMIDGYRPQLGELTAMWVSKVAPMRTEPASPLLRAILPARWKAVETCSRCVSSCVQVRRSRCRAASVT
jgi:hypothetical protein